MLSRHPHGLRAVYYQAEALYNLSDFEYSLMGYQRGARLAPDNERFQMGLIKCRKTISANLHADIFDMTGSSGLRVREFLNGLQSNRERTVGRKRKRIF